MSTERARAGKTLFWYWLFLAPALIAVLLCKWLPVLGTFCISLVKWNVLYPARFLGLANYKNIPLDTMFWKYAMNSLFLSGFTALLIVLLSLFVTVLLVEAGGGRSLLRKLFLIPLACLSIGIGIVWRWIYNPDFGLINYLLSFFGIKGPQWLASTAWSKPSLVFMNVWQFTGLGILVFLARLKGISKETYDEMKTLRLSFWGRIRQVYVRHLLGSAQLIFILVFAAFFYYSSNQYVMTAGGPAGSTTNLGYYIYNNAYQWFSMGYSSAISITGIALMLALAVLTIKVIGKYNLGLVCVERKELLPGGVDGLKAARPSRLTVGVATSVLTIIAISQMLPFIWSISTSLKEPGDLFSHGPQFIPPSVNLENYATVFEKLPLLRFFANSLFVSSVITVVTVVTSFLAAYSVAVVRGPFHRGFCLVILLSLFLPLHLLSVPVFVAARWATFINSYPAMILPNLASPLAFLIFILFLERFPEGALSRVRQNQWSDWRILWKAVLPLSRPVILLAGVVVFFCSWNQFFWPLICIDDMQKKTLPVGLVSLQGLHTTEWTLLAAASCMAILPPIVLFLCIEKPIFSSLALTGSLPTAENRERSVQEPGESGKE